MLLKLIIPAMAVLNMIVRGIIAMVVVFVDQKEIGKIFTDTRTLYSRNKIFSNNGDGIFVGKIFTLCLDFTIPKIMLLRTPVRPSFLFTSPLRAA
jgi:hypothetical protein